MLSYFRIQNYRSILDMKVDFSYAEGKAPNNYNELSKMPFLKVSTKGKKNRFVPCLVIYGANASGKTNIFKAMSNYVWLLNESGISYSYFPNLLNRQYCSTAFELELFVGKDKYRHLIEYDGREIIKEELFKNDSSVYRIDNTPDKLHRSFNQLKNEQYDEEKLKSVLDIECCEKEGEKYLQKRVFFSVIAKNYPGLSGDVTTAFNRYNNNIFIYSSNDMTKEVLKKYNDLIEANSKIESEIIDRLSSLIRNFDIDILKVKPVKEHIPVSGTQGNYFGQYRSEKILYRRYDRIKTFHKAINGREEVFDMFHDESNGTNVLFSLLDVVLLALDLGLTIVVDELDKSLHPFIVAEIIKMFKSKEYNKKNAQLIFTTHCADILDMDILRVSEVGFVSKNIKEGSKIRRISDFEDESGSKIRNTADFRKLYFNGAFGCIPFPYI
ncbi:MAG: ATP-binding protein [Endomicrobium sp.]|nr:ATP-binding protein [Endomicrobium sp.]